MLRKGDQGSDQQSSDPGVVKELNNENDRETLLSQDDKAKHFFDEIQKLKDDLQIIRRSGVSVDDIKDALFSPESVDPPAVRASGKRSVRYIGKNCVVTVNPDTGELIQTNLRKKGKKNA